jgi:hypothetical protein
MAGQSIRQRTRSFFLAAASRRRESRIIPLRKEKELFMQLAVSLRNWALGVATASFICAGAAWAQPHVSTHESTMQQQSGELVGATVRLQQKLDARRAHEGQVVRARLDDSVKADGVRLAKGTELTGKVDRVQASTGGGPSMLSVVFSQARMKDGRSIPVKVTVIGVYPADEAALAVDGAATMPPPPRHVSSGTRIDQQPGLVGRVSLHSAVQSPDSATFRDDRGNLKLGAGTFLQVGIAPANGASSQG